ncbi:iron-containing alcohol dehydrogenase family protein [Prochlorococcus marinus]|uniref:iron-containing alcohol dehydrogenase family protein n=1 Tax=Prochlorococcus marinus TaxID=1219 RepID=UPI0022B5E409|nr:iron-containing alcohol dehydrogenase family protein [Prochlorococcus marinus]
MQIKNILHKIAPENVIRGENAWEQAKTIIPQICKKPLFLGRSKDTLGIRKLLTDQLRNCHVVSINAQLKFDCCEIDLKRIYEIANENNCDAIIASGGGKVLDAGKLLAYRLNLPCITIPLSASTCAGWTALSNIYSSKGAFIKDQSLNTCPKLIIFDHQLVRKAPKRLLASGIADALAKWYESSISSGKSDDGLVQQAVQMARVLRDQLLLDGYEALKNPYSKSWEKVAEGCSLTAGLIGGIGGPKCRTSAAHAVHNGLTQLSFSKKPLHGEIVGFGILVQLRLEELFSNNQLAYQSKKQITKLLKELDLPTNLTSLGLENYSLRELDNACSFSCNKNSDIHNMPFKIDKEILKKAILDINKTTIDVVKTK